MKFTKERLEEIAEDGFLKHGESKELARMALAGMEAEPVLYASEETLAYAKHGELHLRCLSQPMGDCVIPLYTAPQPLTTSERAELENYRNAQQVVPDEKVIGTFDAEKNELALLDKNMTVEKFAHWHVHNSLEVIVRPIRAAMQGKAEAGNSPVIPDGWVIVPKRLTAENGAKATLLGEFNLEYRLTCHECFGEGCEDCSGEGAWTNTVPVDWATIKDIWAKSIDHFAAAPQQEAKS